MKRIITYLIVLLITLPATGQIFQEEHQKPERFKKHKVIDAFKEGKKHKKDNYRDFIVKLKEIQKLAKADDKKEMDSLVSSQWDDNFNVWNNYTKEEFTYDANENVNSFITSMWNYNTLEWNPTIKFEFTFDPDRNLTVLISYFQFVPNQWDLYNKSEFTYDGNGNLTTETTFFWTNLQWVNSYKIEYTYDGNQNMILETGFEWFPSVNQWLNSYKDELTYDMSNKLTLENNFYWNYGTSQWDPWAKWDYTYDGSNNLISEISSDWDGNQWVNNGKYEYTYNTAGYLTVDIGSNWNSGTSQWVYVYKDEYTYDGNGNRTVGNYYEWLQGPGEWSNYYYDEFIFDLAFDMDDIIGPILFVDVIGVGFGDIEVGFNNMVIGYLGFEYSNQAWVDTDKVIFHYSNYNNALSVDDEILAKSLKVYPNPVDQILTIDSEIPLTKVEVYSILGRKVKEINSGFNAIHLNNLSNGIYIIKILSEKGSATRKLIKK